MKSTCVIKSDLFFQLVCAFTLLLIFQLLYSFIQPVVSAEPDIYFHLAMAKQFAEQGLVLSVPQVEGLKWGEHYPEKNLLFTLLVTAFYKIGGESFALHVPRVLASLYVLLLFLAGARISSKKIGSAVAFILVLFLMLSPPILNRLCLFRPHVLAMSCFLIFLFGILKEKRLLIFLGALSYTLSYHAFYLLILPLVLFPLAGKRESRTVLSCILYGLSGMVIGLIANPYFPDNLYWANLNAKIALSFLKPGGLIPAELFSPSFSYLFENLGAFIVLVGVCGIVLIRKPIRSELSYLFCLSLLFGILLKLNFRSIEYVPPLLLFVSLTLYKEFSQKWKVAMAFTVLFLAIHGVEWAKLYARPLKPMGSVASHFAALEYVPVSSLDQRVFNCEWGSGPYILYKRPDLKFVDVWGPYLLNSVNPLAHELRQRINSGEVRHPFMVLRNYFHADYVLCRHPKFVRQMEQNPNFRRLFPPLVELVKEPKLGKVYLYALK